MKENQRVILTKRLLKEGLLRLLNKKTLDKINVSELCREAGINRATFYNHYETPRDVLIDVERELAEKMRGRLIKPRSMQEAERCLEEICSCLYEHADVVNILMRCNADENFLHALNELNQGLWVLREDLTQFGELDEDSRRLISTFLGSGGYFLLRQWLMEDIPKTPKEIAAIIFGIIRKEYTP